jgi:hypothetical protein
MVLFINLAYLVMGLFSVFFTNFQMAVQSGTLILLMMWKPKNVSQAVTKLKTNSSQIQSGNHATSTSSSAK